MHKHSYDESRSPAGARDKNSDAASYASKKGMAWMSTRRPALDLISHSPDQTKRLGLHLGRLARPGDVILLSGQVGTGKTALTQGLARALSVDDYVQSPTFTLAAEYPGRLAGGTPVTLFHLDFYRLTNPGDLATFGFDEYLDAPDGITVIEWPNLLVEDLPDAYLLIELQYLAESKRKLIFRPVGSRYIEFVDAFRREVFGARDRTNPARH